jgi:hypothetical protein
MKSSMIFLKKPRFFCLINDMKKSRFKVFLQFSWRRGSKDPRGQGFKGLFFKDFISVFNILTILAMSLFYVKHPNIIQISLNRVRMTFARLSTLCNSLAFLSASSVEDHSNPGILESLNPMRSHLLN